MRSLVRGPEGQIPEAAVDRPAQDLITVGCPDFDLSLTLKSGQVFRWRKGLSPQGTVPFFTGWIDGSFARVSQEGNRLLLQGVSENSARRFFSLDTDLPDILRQIDVDPVIHEAIRQYPGLRVIRQDPWECAASFLLSAFNNIPRLTQMLETLSQKFGVPGRPRSGSAGCAPLTIPRRGIASLGARPRSPPPLCFAKRSSGGSMPASASRRALPAVPGSELDPAVPLPSEGEAGPGTSATALARFPPPLCFAKRSSGGESAARIRAKADTLGRPSGDRPASPERGMARPNSFPRPEILAKVSERVLRNCGLGYRAPYLRAVAQTVASGRAGLERWRNLEDEKLRRALLTLPGIGEKVVECVMLFAYGRGAAFPVDVWIGRAMRQWYFRRRKVTDRRVREFARKHFGPYCGWAQQVLYCYARKEIT